MNTTLSISNKGMFLNNDRVNLLESDFRKHLCKYGISDDSIANCVIFYSYNPEETVFIQKMEIWLTKDKTPLSEDDIKKIEALQNEAGFTYNNQLTLNTTVHFESETGSEFNIPTGFEFINYDCTYFKNTKVGLQCFLLFKNLPLYNEEAVQKAKRTPFSIFNVIDAGAGYLELLLNCGVNPNEGLYDNLFTPLMYAVFHKNINATKILLEHGANVNATTTANGTALRIAVHMKNTEMAALLIEYGADVNSITDGITNLRFALEEPAPNKEMVRLLSLCGGIINIDDNNAAFCLTEDLEAALSLWSFKEIITSSPAAYVPSSKHKEL